MGIIVSNIRLSIDYEDHDAVLAAKKIVGAGEPAFAHLYKKSIDARRNEIAFVYSIFLGYTDLNEKELVGKIGSPFVYYYEEPVLTVKTGSIKMKSSPVVCGFGPAGMFAALALAEHGFAPVVIERGADLDRRMQSVKEFWNHGKLNPSTNVQFGAGGAGTFSDGKLTTRINDPICRLVLKQFIEYGAPHEILYMAKPHIGTDILKGIVKNIKERIEALGGKVYFEKTLTGLEIKNHKLVSVKCSDGEKIDTEQLIMAIGHSARDTYRMLYEMGFDMESKPFSIGLRIEHLQSEIDKARYGKYAGHKNLKAADYQLVHKEDNRTCYTFCMCPGGTVIAAASEEDGIVTNGMSEHARNKQNANSAVVVAVNKKDFGSDPLDGVKFQQHYERQAFILGGSSGAAPIQTVGSFVYGKKNLLKSVEPSYTGKVSLCDLSVTLPDYATKLIQSSLVVFGKKIDGFDHSDAVLTGVETRTSAPIRIIRQENFQSPFVSGVYPCGEGAGYAGGIMSAAVDGIKTAISIMREYTP